MKPSGGGGGIDIEETENSLAMEGMIRPPADRIRCCFGLDKLDGDEQLRYSYRVYSKSL